MENLIGQVIKGYELRELIGEGGFGAVYLASQRMIAREVAVKIILPQHANQPDFIRRFESEAQLVARLEHPHIVPLYDYWREPSGAYLVMRFLRGGSIHTSLKNDGPWQAYRVSTMVTQIASALAVAHRQGIVHRDLKPENIILDEDGNSYLSDFGIAKDLVAQDNITQNNAIVGSPAYISPEQIRGQDVTQQSDVYMFGLLVWEMLIGHHPFEGNTAAALMYKHLSEPLPSMHEINNSIPIALDLVIQRATAKDPADRYEDVLKFATDFRRAVRDGVLPPFDASETAVITSSSLQLPEPENPYKGLRAFQQADASDFFGRESLVEKLIERMQEDVEDKRFLAVIGPSGSGKSSVVKAGLIPHLQKGALPGSKDWFIVEMVPGIDPMEELEAALLRVAVNPPETLLKQLNEDDRGFLRAAKRILPDDGTELLLFIDQFEELFTLVEEEDMRRHFMESLIAAASDPRSPIRIVITMRADFYDKPLNYGGFGALLQKRTEIVLPLNADEIERAINGPAERAGIVLERGLATAIVTEVNEQPGALPLLQYALTELFERREGRALTISAYRDIGGTMGALARRADELYAGLDEEGEEAARQMFLRLVTLGEGTEDTRRRVIQSELLSVGNTMMMEVVLEAFGRYRLLTFDHDPQNREPTVEVAHEALIRQWSKLRAWLDESREDLRMQRRLANAAEEWRHSGKDLSFLARGSRLEQFEEWSGNTSLSLNQEEREYLNESIRARELRLEEERLRQEREEMLEARSRRRLRMLVAVFAIGFVIAAVLGAIAITESQQAQAARVQAESNASEARSLALAANARNALIENDPMLALSLAIEANEAFTPPPVEVTRILASTTYGPGILNRMTGHTASVTSVDYNADSTLAVSASADGTLRIWNPLTGEEVLVFGEVEDADFYTSVRYSPDGRYIASGESMTQSYDADTGELVTAGRVRLWDATSGELVKTLGENGDGHTDVVTDVDFSADGTRLLTGSLDRTMLLWDVDSGEIVQRFVNEDTDSDFAGGIVTVDLSPNGRLAASGHVDELIRRSNAGQRDRTVRVWEVETGRVSRRYNPELGFIRSVNFSPDSRQVMSASWSGSAGGVISVWNVLSLGNETVRIFADAAVLTSAEFSSDGRYAVAASWGRNISLWDLSTGAEVQRFTGLDDRVLDAEFSHDDQYVIVVTGNIGGNEIATPFEAAIGSSVWVIDLVDRSEITTFAGHEDWIWDIDMTTDGTRVASGGGSFSAPILDGRVLIWDSVTGEQITALGNFVNEERATLSEEELAEFTGHTNTVDGVAFSADGTQLLSGAWDKRVLLWDVASGEILREYFGHEAAVYTTDISPDGRYGISGDVDGQLILWDLSTGEEILRFEGHEAGSAINHATFSPDSTKLLAGIDDFTMVMWDVETGEVLQRFVGHSSGVNQVDFSHDQTRAASTSWDGTVRLWDVETGAQIREFTGHDSETFGIAFSPDDTMLISGSSDQTVRLWDVATGDEIRLFAGHTSWIQGVKFHPDGTFAVSGAQDNVLKSWRTIRDSDAILDFAEENRYIRGLNCAEQERYRVDIESECATTASPEG